MHGLSNGEEATRLSDSLKCVVCGQIGTAKWTINKGSRIAVVDVCPNHEASLEDLLRKGRPVPRDREINAPGETMQRKYPRPHFEPLEWRPPA